MPVDGVQSDFWIDLGGYDTIPDDRWEWRTWCRGANLLAYDPNIVYEPWKGVDPLNGNPFPDMTDITQVWVNPGVADGIDGSTGNDDLWHRDDTNGNYIVGGRNYAIIDLSNAPVVTGWNDADGDGIFDPEECPVPSGDFSWGRADAGDPIMSFYDASSYVKRASELSPEEQKNFANWFAYYRTRMHTTKAAVTRVVATSSARMGMTTLHHNNSVGKAVADMSVFSNKDVLLEDLVAMDPSGGTPLRQFLNNVGQYFQQGSSTPSQLNIGAAPSPILPQADGGECQQNFAMLMTDGQWNGGSPGVGHQDQTVDSTHVYPAHRDNVSNTLADVAMRWYKTDLAPGLAGKVPTQTGDPKLNLDENAEQHLVTFGVAFGPVGTLSSDPADRNASFSWPTPSSNSDETVDDLRHAAYNGRGLFLSARDPAQLISVLETVIADIEARQGSAAAVSFNTTALEADTLLFSANFNTVDWRGDLVAWKLDPATGQLLSSQWKAADKLDAHSDADMTSNRVIYTWGDTSAGRDGVIFNWWDGTPPEPDSALKNDFLQNPDGSTESAPFTDTQERVAFLQGDRSKEGSTLRDRGSRLGDIIHSSPAFVGKPASGWPDGAPFGSSTSQYSSYVAALTSSPREAVVYVGANDGLLHGFRVRDGEEILAYLPGAMSSSLINSGLHYLSELDYNHRYYVDGTPVVADAFIRTEASGARSWRTILVGALRGGGRGLFALDVTDPSVFSKTETAADEVVLWEFTDQDDPDLGYTFSTPQVAMMNNGKWAVIVGNGYNSTGSQTAKMMVIYVEGGVDGAWSAGDYLEIDTGVGGASNPNGLSTPALIDLNDDGIVDRAYAGDLHGNLWAFDLSDSNEANWKVAYENSGTPKPLFAAGSTKPITMKPLLLRPDWINDTAANKPNIMIYFGTGQYLATGDAANTDSQTFYGIWDAGAAVNASNLVEQTFITLSDPDARALTQNPVNYDDPPSAGNLGWYVNLPDTGERVVVDAFEIEDIVFFNTIVPQSAPCSAGGYSFLMSVDAKTGGSATKTVFDYNGDDLLDDSDKVDDKTLAGERFDYGIASASSVLGGNGKNYQYTSGTNTMKPQRRRIIGSGNPTGKRLSWIEVVQ